MLRVINDEKAQATRCRCRHVYVVTLPRRRLHADVGAMMPDVVAAPMPLDARFPWRADGTAIWRYSDTFSYAPFDAIFTSASMLMLAVCWRYMAGALAQIEAFGARRGEATAAAVSARRAKMRHARCCRQRREAGGVRMRPHDARCACRWYAEQECSGSRRRHGAQRACRCR